MISLYLSEIKIVLSNVGDIVSEIEPQVKQIKECPSRIDITATPSASEVQTGCNMVSVLGRDPQP